MILVLSHDPGASTNPSLAAKPRAGIPTFDWAMLGDDDEDELVLPGTTPPPPTIAVKAEDAPPTSAAPEPTASARPTAEPAPPATAPPTQWAMPWDDDDEEEEIVYMPSVPTQALKQSPVKSVAPAVSLAGTLDTQTEKSTAFRPDFPVTEAQKATASLVLQNTPQLKISDPINWFLREYQRDGVRFLYNCYRSGRGGILADDMGLGKTIQVIAFLSAIMRRSGYEAEDENKRVNLLRQMAPGDFAERVKDWPTALIACPATLRDNWLNEIRKWSYLSVGVLGSSAKANKEVLNEYRLGQLDVVLGGLEHLREHIEEYKQYDFSVVIVDEAHRIKNSESTLHSSLSKLKPKVRLALTGTPFLNGYGELWELLRWIDPEQFPDASAWETDVATPIETGQSVEATPVEIEAARVVATRLVTKLLPTYMIRRTKELLKDIIPEKSDYVVVCTMSEQQHRFYRRLWAEPEMQAIIHSHDPCPCGRRTAKGHRTKRRWCHDRVFFSRLQFKREEEPEEDSLADHELAEPPAYEEWRRLEDEEAKESGKPVERRQGAEEANAEMPMKYQHILLSIANHLALAFPDKKEERSDDPSARERYKRQMASIQKLYPKDWEIRLKQSDVFTDVEYCGKWRVLRALLEAWRAEGDAKVLIFSKSLRLLNFIEHFVESEAYPYRRLDGSTPQHKRQPYVDEFNNDPSVFVFLISIAAGGVGLNLTGANKVIIFDPSWTPALDMQAMDRAHRTGQKRKVDVFRLLSQGSIEERIYERQLYKMTHANIALEGKQEQRLFKAHQGQKNVPTEDTEGELFGWSNLFGYLPDQRVGRIIEEAQKINGVEGAGIINDTIRDDLQIDAVEDEVDRAWVTQEANGNGKQKAAAQKDVALSTELDKILSHSTIGFVHKSGDVVGRGATLSVTHDEDDVAAIEAFWRERAATLLRSRKLSKDREANYRARKGALPRQAESLESLTQQEFESLPSQAKPRGDEALLRKLEEEREERKWVKRAKTDGSATGSGSRASGSKSSKKKDPAPVWPPPRKRGP